MRRERERERERERGRGRERNIKRETDEKRKHILDIFVLKHGVALVICKSWVRVPSNVPVVSSIKKLNPNYLVLVDPRTVSNEIHNLTKIN